MLWLVKIWQVISCGKFMQHLETYLLIAEMLEIFLKVSLKAHYYPTYHKGADCSYWTDPTLLNSLHENLLKSSQFHNLLCKGSACFDRPKYRMTYNLSCKIVKNCILSDVCMIKTAPHSTVYFTCKKKNKRLLYTPPDLLARFWIVNLSNAKKPAWFCFPRICFPGLIYCGQEPLWLKSVIEDDCYFLGVYI